MSTEILSVVDGVGGVIDGVRPNCLHPPHPRIKGQRDDPDRKSCYRAEEARSFANLTTSHDLKEGTLAFLEKRKPNFTGN